MLTISKGFGVTARSTIDTRKLDPTAIIVFHQAYVDIYPNACTLTKFVTVMLASTFGTRKLCSEVVCKNTQSGYEVLRRTLH